MIRSIFWTLTVLLATATGVRALEPVAVTIDSVSSTDTVRGVDISSHTAFDIIVSTLPLYRQACVQNLDTSAFLACSDSLNVSTLTANGAIGVVLPAAPTATTPATPTCFSVVAGNRWYCRTSSVTGTTRAVIIRGR